MIPKNPIRIYPVIDTLAAARIPIRRACTVLGVSSQCYYKHKLTPTTPTALRRAGPWAGLLTATWAAPTPPSPP